VSGAEKIFQKINLTQCIVQKGVEMKYKENIFLKTMAKKNKLSQLEVDYMFLRWGFMDGITKPIAEVAKKLKIDIKKALKIESKILEMVAEEGIK
jgi:hypothetical protein